jgi:hypothetical protein
MKLKTVFLSTMLMTLTATAGIEEVGRKLAADYGNAVVHVTAVIKMTAEGPLAAAMGGPQEQKAEALATIIDSSGLAVVAESALNPTVLMKDMKIMGQPLKMTATLSDVKLRLSDGTEIAGRVVLKDSDLDLAFVAPTKAVSAEDRKKFAVVDLKNAATVPKLLDSTIELSRLNDKLNYETSLSVGRITSVVKKPRTFYTGSTAIGSPVFATDGKLLGLCMMRRGVGGDPGGGMLGMGAGLAATAVIVPVEDVSLVAEQAKEELE